MNALTVNNSTELQVVEFNRNIYSRFISYLDVKPKTVETYSKALRQLFNFFDVNGITQPTRDDIIAFREELKAEHKPTTVQTYMVAVRLLFRWTAEENIYPNIADHIKGSKIDRDHKKDYLTSNQVKKILSTVERDSLQGKRDYAILTLMLTGGLRTIEVERADVTDFGTVGDDTVLYVQGKGRDEKTEYVKIPLQVECAIRDYLNHKEPTQEKALFTSTSNNNYGQRMTTRSISGLVKKHMKNAGYDSERLTAHSLRHTAVTLSLLQGKKLDEVQQFARHSSLATTMIYNHRLEKAQNGCSSAIADVIF